MAKPMKTGSIVLIPEDIYNYTLCTIIGYSIDSTERIINDLDTKLYIYAFPTHTRKNSIYIDYDLIKISSDDILTRVGTANRKRIDNIIDDICKDNDDIIKLELPHYDLVEYLLNHKMINKELSFIIFTDYNPENASRLYNIISKIDLKDESWKEYLDTILEYRKYLKKISME